MYFSINSKVNLKIREFIHSNINTNLLLQEEEILIKCKDKKLILYSNNNFTESKLVFSEEIKYKKQGEVVLGSKTLLSILESLKHQEEIEFQKVENSLIKVSSEKFECNLISLVKKFLLVEENLVIPENSKKITLEFEFLNLINNRFKDFYKNLGSNLQKNTVYNTINFKKNKSYSEINVLVTDSYRILFASFSFSDILDEEFQFNLHTEILSCIILLFKDKFENKKLNFYIKGDSLLVNSEGLIFRTKLNSSNYPNLSNLFKQEEQLSFTINKNLLISAIDRNLLLAEQNLNITSYKVLEDNLVLEYRDSSRGFTKEEIKVIKHKGENIHFSLNSLFLKQLLKNISDDEIIFNISEAYKPIVLFGKNEGINFKQIILPLKYS
ncbi:DNA polymerase III subunit beta [Mycoplasma wenyonii str. Massachusetts]|uniref:DNA polymerase III subunit beta n=1 Tax=Mycoplasma wenyonii (strain Massachusetts) TaxID=1197325 RepID=I6ZE43_MYCWM|nr:DNA polymerase III subunit beta [Mycoplasma wenyonii]AFN64812.1 DNA polymerase III subunit beta [Mycoplasma wenyonii str. Massachusetts]